MTVSTAQTLNSIYNATKAVGNPRVVSDATLDIDNFPGMYLTIKAFPWAVLSPGEPIEVPMPLGVMRALPGQTQVRKQGSIQLIETVTGASSAMLRTMIRNRGIFNAWLYEGTPERFVEAHRIIDAFIVAEPPDRSWEDNTVALTISGTIHFHYFGQITQGDGY